MVYLGDTKGSGEENKNQPDNNTTGGEENENQTGDTTGGEENKNQTGDTTGGEKNETDFTKKTQPSRSPVLESQITYTGPSLNVADANDDEETPNESTTALKRAAENFRNTAENVTNYVIRIINKATGNDNTLNVTLKDVNIDASSSKTNDAALSVEGAGDTKITLVGDNKLTSGNQCAGLEHNEESTGTTGKLTITSGTDKNGNNTGSLTATGSGASAGIGSVTFFLGSGAGIIEIAGGTITEAIGGDGGAGIGSGANSFGTTTVNITSGTVKAQGGDYGAGIGGGDNSRNTNITISGGTIEEAVGGSTGDGIGGGNNSSNITVTIQGGTIKKAQGGKGNFYAGHGIHSDSTLNISGGTIENAQGGNGNYYGGHGIYSDSTLNISGKAFIQNAKGGDGGTEGGSGIRSDSTLDISDQASIQKATGGESQSTGGSGIYNHGKLTIFGGTIGTAQGGEGKSSGSGNGGHGIYSKTMEILGGII